MIDPELRQLHDQYHSTCAALAMGSTCELLEALQLAARTERLKSIAVMEHLAEDFRSDKEVDWSTTIDIAVSNLKDRDTAHHEEHDLNCKAYLWGYECSCPFANPAPA